MTETEFTGTILKNLRTIHRDWIVFKHADKFTTGIPDMSVTADSSHTTWLEMKYFSIESNPTSEFKPAKHLAIGVQMLTMAKIEARGNALYVIGLRPKFGALYVMFASPKWLIHAIRESVQLSVHEWPVAFRTTQHLDKNGYFIVRPPDHLVHINNYCAGGVF